MESKIKSISVTGFQAHNDFKCDLDPGITTIVGPSDVGKSSLIRAIRWVSLNNLKGFDFLRWGSKQADVGLSFSDQIITRSRSDKQNTYCITWRDDCCQFDAVSGSVPPEIQKELKITDENFQGQFDSPFWLSETAGEVSRHLNRVVNLKTIDHHLAQGASFVRKAGIATDLAKETYQGAKAAFLALQFVPDLEADFDALNDLNNQIESLHIDDIEPLEVWIEGIQEWQNQIKETKGLFKDFDVLNGVGLDFEKHHNRMVSLTGRISDLEAAMVTASQKVPSLDALVLMCSHIKELTDQITQFSNLIESLQTVETEQSRIGGDLFSVQNQLRNSLANGCPLCGQ